MKLKKIDHKIIGDHSYLELKDECFYWVEYTSHQGFKYSEPNKWILNLKKCPSSKNTTGYQYKKEAIKIFANFFSSGKWDNCSIIPVPPSKSKKDPKYDDRLIQILKLAKLDYLDIIVQENSYPPEHNQTTRANPEELKKRYSIENNHKLNDTIIIFDDIITTGAHFKTIRNLIATEYPSKKIKGLFIARRIFPPPSFEALDIDE